MAPSNFKPALIIVDLQEDFCPPNGSLAVQGGREIAPLINNLLSLPFILKIATKDWHPPDHISFFSNHPNASPFTSFTTVTNPLNPQETYSTRLWPPHCIQNTPGASLIPELEIGKVDKIIEKGTRKEVEMYSAFYDPLENPRCSDSGLSEVLKGKGVTDVYVVGLAFDYCVKATAVDAVKEGFRTWVVREGTRAVDVGAWEECERELVEKGVGVVGVEEEEIGWVGKV